MEASLGNAKQDKGSPVDLVRHITACQSAALRLRLLVAGDQPGAADVLQEANVVLWEKADEYDSGRPFLPWAYRIAYFQVLAYRKRMSRDRLVFDDELLAMAHAAIARSDDEADRQLSALEGCMGKLPSRRRALLDARYRDDEPVDGLARRIGKAPNAVAAELYRVRKWLMDCIRKTLRNAGAS